MPEERPVTDLSTADAEQLRALVVAQAKLIEQLRQRIAELEARLGKDSHNSSKPPSSDPPFRKPPPRSRRKPSGRNPDGEKGHKGTTCAWLAGIAISPGSLYSAVETAAARMQAPVAAIAEALVAAPLAHAEAQTEGLGMLPIRPRHRPLRVIRSYLSTLRKQSADLFKCLVLTFQGSPPRPRLAPE